MKRINNVLMRAVSALVLGLILVCFPNDVSNYLVITVGVLFMIPSLISLLAFFAKKSGVPSMRRFPVEALGSLLFGLWLVLNPDFFADFLVVVLGFVLTMGGVGQVASLLAARKWSRVSPGFFVIPVIILLSGLVALFNPTGVKSTTIIIIGVASLVYALNELLNWFKFMRRRPAVNETTSATGEEKAPVIHDTQRVDDDGVEDAVIIED